MRPTRYQKRVVADLFASDARAAADFRKATAGWIFTDYHKYANEYRGLRKYRFYFKIYRGYLRAYWKMLLTRVSGKCYVGPFVGEFGNFLSFILPFLNYLHSKKIEVHYCGMGLFKPFMYDEERKLIVSSFVEVSDFLYEASPNGNSVQLPKEVEEKVNAFKHSARESGAPFWDLDDSFFYWYVFRTWIGPFMKTPALEKIYKTADENSVVIFPRKKYVDFNVPYGEAWDFEELARTVSPFFDKVYLLGHPAQSMEMRSHDNVEVLISTDNAVLIEKCANARLIITQHSGTKYLGELTNTQVLVIYKGQFPIFGMLDNAILNYRLGKKHPWHFAFSLEEVKNYCAKFNKTKTSLI
jgi:hypothetical protein